MTKSVISYKSQVLSPEETSDLLLSSDPDLVFSLLSHWKISPEKQAKLSTYKIKKTTAGKLIAKLTSGKGRYNGFIPIYRSFYYADLIRDNPESEYWLSFRSFGALKIVLIMKEKDTE